jgi:hypothetical protein
MDVLRPPDGPSATVSAAPQWGFVTSSASFPDVEIPPGR